MAIIEGWTRADADENGWYVHPERGSICHGDQMGMTATERKGWWWYPPYAENKVKHRKGPYPTLRTAAQAAEMEGDHALNPR